MRAGMKCRGKESESKRGQVVLCLKTKSNLVGNYNKRDDEAQQDVQ